MTLPVDIGAYFDSLVARVSTAVIVPQVPIARSEDSFNNCHDNATKWVAEHPEYQVVRGWLLWPQAGPPYMLHAHSVVIGPDGLVDVTPLRESGLHFLRHTGSKEEFLSLAKRYAQHIHGLDFTL
ncbi:hypothetical protein [Bradyrhizobium sp. SZCCHNRI1029]|uniref:hypothetical protein n=1 Tax=Bradyrhizobium sp. SZCCHNRI1029 TaxID=3057278 RepID=UPI002916109A|nr:hypothetical protein [Bradyrhizobium sp. SZCCHNRI1029]